MILNCTIDNIDFGNIISECISILDIPTKLSSGFCEETKEYGC